MMLGRPPERDGRASKVEPLPPEAALIVQTVGLDFLAAGGPAFVASPDGSLLWANGDAVAMLSEQAAMTGADPLILPWETSEISGRALSTGGDVVTLTSFAESMSGPIAITSRHWASFDTMGNFLGVASCVESDSLTHRLQKESAGLRDRLDDLMKLVTDWVWECGSDLTLTFISHRASDSLGFHPQQLIGRRLTELGRFVDPAGEPVDSPFRQDAPVPFQERAYVIPDAGRTERQVRMSGVPVFDTETGQFRGFRGTAQDITVEHTALGLLRTSRRQLNQAIEAVSDGFALFDADERLLLCNHRFLEAFPHSGRLIQRGMSEREIMALAIEAGDVLPGEGCTRLINDSITNRAREMTASEYEVMDGRWFRATDRITSEGTIVGIRTDITELKRREQALTESKVAAESANRAKSEFLANISHELRTPLNAILGYSELMMQEALGPIGNATYKQYLGDIHSSGRNLLNIINDIIDLSKAESGDLSLAEELTEIDRLVEMTRRMMQEPILRSGLAFQTNVEADLPLLFCDERKVRQVLMALVSNALKFTPEGGLVTLNAAKDKNSGQLLLTVADTGIGIAEENIAKILRPFGQVDGAINRKYEGAGLGLALTRALTELHGGELAIESTVGVGTTVIVRLPADRLRSWPIAADLFETLMADQGNG